MAHVLQRTCDEPTLANSTFPRGLAQTVRRLSVELLGVGEAAKVSASTDLVRLMNHLTHVKSLELVTRVGIGGGASGTEWVPKQVAEAVARLTQLRELEWGDCQGRVVTLFNTEDLLW